MMSNAREIVVPIFYKPRPYQVEAWLRKQSGIYNYYFKLWHRQAGKDSSDLQEAMKKAWDKAGTQTAYVGLDNVWIAENIFKKTIEGRKFWAEYPDEMITPKDTSKEVYFHNNDDPNVADARIKFIGFLNDQQLIGSSYDNFVISEGSLYKRNAFEYIEPIWDQKEANGENWSVSINGTPRGIKNNLYDMLCTYTGVDDPDLFPGEHVNKTGSVRCYVDKLRADQSMVFDKTTGELRRLFTDEQLEVIRQRCIRKTGNDRLFRQEYLCDFTTVNAGLVYGGVEALMKEHRFCKFNLDTTKPLYAAFDISSKGSYTDATSAIIFQYYNGQMFIYDIYEERGKSFVECLTDVAKRDYWQYMRFIVLPWDSERSASSETPIEEARRMFPTINFHALDKERVDRGIQLVRNMMPNMIINSDNCDFLLDALNNYEYKWFDSLEDWSTKPIHNKWSHICDALRYAVMGINEVKYLKLNDDGSPADLPRFYDIEDEEARLDNYGYPITWKKPEKRTQSGLYYF